MISESFLQDASSKSSLHLPLPDCPESVRCVCSAFARAKQMHTLNFSVLLQRDQSINGSVQMIGPPDYDLPLCFAHCEMYAVFLVPANPSFTESTVPLSGGCCAYD